MNLCVLFLLSKGITYISFISARFLETSIDSGFYGNRIMVTHA